MRATLLLADSAQTDPANKIHALGIGWSITSSPTPPAALVLMIQVPWNATNARHTFSLRLVDADGHPVQLPTPEGPATSSPVGLDGEFEVGRPAGIPPGSDLNQNLTVNLAPGMPLPGGQAYEWRLEIDGHHEENWAARFFVRP